MVRRARFLVFVAVTLLCCLFGATVGCGADSYEGGTSTDDEVASNTQALSGVCDTTGVCQFQIKLPSGLAPSQVVLAASSSLKVNDRVTLADSAGLFVPSTNTGASSGPLGQLTEVGSQAQAGTIYSVPGVFVRSQGVVNGDALSSGSVSLQDASAVVRGTIQENVGLSPFKLVSWTASFPSTAGAAIMIEPGQSFPASGRLEPGGYPSVFVKANARLKLKPGIFYFREIIVDAGGIVDVDNAQPVQIYTKDTLGWQGAVAKTVPATANVLFVHVGTSTVHLQRAFEATLVAPNTNVILNTVTSSKHAGQWFARDVEVHQGMTVLHEPYVRADCATADPGGCGDVLGCAPRDTDGDSLSDCAEQSDLDPWTDPAIFNGVQSRLAQACSGGTTCSNIDTATEVNSCVSSRPALETRNQFAGWNSVVAPDGVSSCSPQRGYRPNWSTCRSDFQVESKGKIKLDNGGLHCFSVVGETSGECASLLVGTNSAAIKTGGTQCYTLSPGVHDVRWLYNTTQVDQSGYRVRYCHGGAQACTPVDAIPSRMLRTSYDGSDLCDPESTTCSELCPCDSGQGTCTSNGQCRAGLSCPADNGLRQRGTSTLRVCEHPSCPVRPALLGCGYDGAPCGRYCSDHVPCSADGDCPPGRICDVGNGVLYGESSESVCSDPICGTTQRMAHCGSEDSTCGKCLCASSCAGKQCGAPLSDGCGGICTGLCADRSPCTLDAECQPGSVCVRDGGPRVGLAAGVHVCLPARCAQERGVECGTLGDACGLCPTRAPSTFCAGRQCGTDPTTGRGCGQCSMGTLCSAQGQCEPVVPAPAPSVPDGNGGTTTVTDLDPAPTSNVGALPGRFGVSDHGTSTFTVPIQVPPGRLGIEPAIALQYTGSRANGRLGVGWQLDGLSSISRCAKTFAMDGWAGPVENDGDDALCLDGKRLIVVGEVGAQDHEFRTEIDSFARIRSLSPEFGAPLSFRVHTKDGRILTYGGVENAIARVGAVARTWALSRVVDRFGNAMTIHYVKRSSLDAGWLPVSTQAIDLQPAAIRYTGFGDAPGDREVVFHYEDRDDPLHGFASGGAGFSVGERLREVETRVSGSRVKSYRLAYEAAPNGSSRVRTITECVPDVTGAEVCKKPTEFSYYDEAGFERQGRAILPQGAPGDFDGDGLMDMLHTRLKVEHQYETHRQITDAAVTAGSIAADAVLGGAGFVLSTIYTNWIRDEIFGKADVKAVRRIYPGAGGPPTRDVQGLTCLGLGPGMVMDVNGDGKDDILEACLANLDAEDFQVTWDLSIRHSHSTGEDNPPGARARFLQLGSPATIPMGAQPMALDLNGDGLHDLLYCVMGSGLRYRIRVFAGGSPVFQDELSVPGSGAACRDDNPRRLAVDSDGDGVLNVFFLTGPSNWSEVVIERGGVASMRDNALPVVGQPYFQNYRVGDFNGDGLADLMVPNTRVTRLESALPPRLVTEGDDRPVFWMNQGGQFVLAQPDTAGVPFGNNVIVLDYDRDGRADILHRRAGPVNTMDVRKLPYTARPIETIPQASSVPFSTFVIDVDDDGNLDILTEPFFSDPSTLFGHDLYRGSGKRTSLLKKVVDGNGNYVEVDYEEDTELPTGLRVRTYTAGTGCEWPVQCVKGLSSLVSEHREGFVLSDGTDRRVRSVQYAYENARVDVAGHGWLGFGRRVLREYDGSGALERTLTVEAEAAATRFAFVPGRWSYPFAGLPTRTTIETAPVRRGAFLNTPSIAGIKRTVEIVNTWETKVSTAPVVFPFVGERSTTVSDDGGPAISSVLEEMVVDVYGNVTSHATSGQPTTTTVSTTFDPTPAQVSDWLVSLPRRQITTSSRSGRTEARSVAFEHSADGSLAAVTREPDDVRYELTTRFVRNANGTVAVIELEDAQGNLRQTAFTYGGSGVFPQTVTNAKLQTSQLRFDERFGELKFVSDPNGIFGQRSYDGFGRLSRVVTPTGETLVSYGAAAPTPSPLGFTTLSALRTVIDTSAGGHVEQELDPLGRPTRIVTRGHDGSDVEQELDYDFQNDLTKVTRPHAPGDATQGVTVFNYDEWHRLTAVLHALGSTVAARVERTSVGMLRPELQHWVAGVPDATEVVYTRDEVGHERAAILDDYGQPLRTIDGENIATLQRATTFAYGAFDLPFEIRQNQSIFDPSDTSPTTLVHDRLGRLQSISDTSTSELYTYTSFDEVQTYTRGPNRLTSFHYDVLGRLERLVDGEGTTQWIYDGAGPNEIGRLVETIRPPTEAQPVGHRMRYAYEPASGGVNRGLLQTTTHVLDGHELVTGYEYDSEGRVSLIHYPALPGGAPPPTIEYVYDPSWKNLRAIDDVTPGAPRKNLWRIDSVEQGQRIRQASFADGSQTNYEYDPQRGFLTSILTQRGGQKLQELRYTYYQDGSLQTRQDLAAGTATETFTYDALNRLKTVQQPQSAGPARLLTYDYDQFGNIDRVSAVGPTVAGVGDYNYWPNLKQSLQSVGGHFFGYDANGNQNTRDLPGTADGFHQLDYTSFDLPSRIISGEDVNAKTTYLEYGASQERIVRRTPTDTVYYAGELYQGKQPAGGGAAEHRYRVFAGGSQVAEIVRGPSGDQLWSLHHDMLGSVTTVSSATSAFQRSFDPFGSTRSGEIPGPSGIRAGFTGHEHDPELELINMRGRIYDPTYARFLTADPITQDPTSTQGLNRFAYVFNDPMNHVDPSGFQADDSTWWGLGAVGAAVGGAVAYNAFGTPATSGAAVGGGMAGSATIYTAGGGMSSAAAAQTLGQVGSTATIAHNAISMLKTPPSTLPGVQATNTASPSMTTGSGDATGKHRAGVLGGQMAQDHGVAICGGRGNPICGQRPFGSDPMDELVVEFLNRTSPDPALAGMSVAESIVLPSSPEHAAHIIRGVDGRLRLGETLSSGAYLETVNIPYPRLAPGEQFVGVIHSHPGVGGGPLAQSRMDLRAARAWARTPGSAFRQSYVVGASDRGPYYGVVLFEPRPQPGTLSSLSLP